jgi:hypothetical protein
VITTQSTGKRLKARIAQVKMARAAISIVIVIGAISGNAIGVVVGLLAFVALICTWFWQGYIEGKVWWEHG